DEGVPSSPNPFSHGRRGAEVSLPGERDLERGHNPGQDEGVPSSPNPFSHGRRGAEVSLPGERDLERGHNPGQDEGVPSSPNPFSHGRRGAEVSLPGERDFPSDMKERGQDVSQLAGARRMIPEALLQRAKELRQSQTPAEQILWECLRAKRLQGAKFRRQHNIGQCIVDFYCHGAKLVIEVDGGIHEQQKERDADRDNWFADHGFRVLRFKNEEVRENLIDVLARIALSLNPSPTGEGLTFPSPAGEGLGVRGNAGDEELEMRTITKLDIFHYTYAVLHNPDYRKKYELNLKRDFPRLPFYDDFFQWANWGQQLMYLHLNYETLEPYPLERVDIPLKETQTYQPKLKADKTKHEIILDNITTLKQIPPTAWDYKLGNRCALEWILDQYKEKKPRDATIREKFNTYRFMDYKETVVDLLLRVCRVSVETMKIIEEISAVKG
ncbi:type ISP restriction/modification enzyme, partial [Roseofilum capinflatum]